MNSLEVREELEALIRRTLARYSRSPQANTDVEAILAAADAYRDAPPAGPFVTHLAGVAGAVTACRYAWPFPDGLAVTGNPAHVSCGRCFRSRLYQDLVAGGGDEQAA